MQIDHIVIKVDDLQAAAEKYRQLGFTVVEGGEHKSLGSRNALIGLADGTYLELIVFPNAEKIVSREKTYRDLLECGESRLKARWLSWAVVPEGTVDFAVTVAELTPLTGSRRAGLDIEGPLPMGRRRPDGQELSWEMGFPESLDLPFIIKDITPREWRVPQITDHQNGVTGISSLEIAVKDLHESITQYQQLLNMPIEEFARSEGAAGQAVFSIGKTFAHLSQQAENDKMEDSAAITGVVLQSDASGDIIRL